MVSDGNACTLTGSLGGFDVGKAKIPYKIQVLLDRDLNCSLVYAQRLLPRCRPFPKFLCIKG